MDSYIYICNQIQSISYHGEQTFTMYFSAVLDVLKFEVARVRDREQ